VACVWRVAFVQTLTGQNTELNMTTNWDTLLTAADVGTWLAQYGGNTMCACMLHTCHIHMRSCAHGLYFFRERWWLAAESHPPSSHV
jgi:hypothetical protein